MMDDLHLSQKKKIKGTRTLVREKILQILYAYETCEVSAEELFSYIFFRDFNFEDINPETNKLLTREEIAELESDIPIEWDEDELYFGKALLQSVIKNRESTEILIKSLAENWEYERIALIDRILIEIGISEMLDFPDIPVKVSINEVIEISKRYSTTKSQMFINGILDKALHKLIEEGKIFKFPNIEK